MLQLIRCCRALQVHWAQTLQYQWIPVDIHVPDKIRQKILQDEFVDFAILLQRQKGDMVYNLAVDSQSGQPNLVLAPQSKKTKLPFTRWVEAWNIFVCMYVTGHPENIHLTPALAQHFQVVCDHFHKGRTGRIMTHSSVF